MRITVKVIPRAKKERIEQFNQGLKIYVCEPAVENRANQQVITLLAEYYQVKPYKLRIVRGQTSCQKVIEFDET